MRLALLALFLLMGCGSDLDTFNVVRGGVALPVVVRGPKSADALLVFQHGGPGGIDLDGVLGFQRILQERFLFAVWAQRTTPYSTGAVRKSNSTLDDHYKDMGAVVGVLRARYPGKRIFAIGYSLGAAITLGHLGGKDPQPVDGMVLIDAPLSGELLEAEDFTLLDAFAETQIAAGHDKSKWESFRELVAKQPEAYQTLSARAYFEHYSLERTARCEDMAHALGEASEPGPVAYDHEIGPNSGLVVPGLFVGARALDWLGPALATFDLSDHAARIQLPTLLLWGGDDCIVAPNVAEQLLQLLSNDDKQLLFKEGTSHAMPMQAPDFVAGEIERFVDAH
jgi:pimeloyl-ACP methyl ester carboxylesterase